MEVAPELHLTEDEIKKRAAKKEYHRIADRKYYAKYADEKRKKNLEAYHKKRAEKIAAGLLPPPKKRGRPRTVNV